MAQQRLYTFSQGLDYAKDYCAKEERCQSQVIDKLVSLGLTMQESEDCVAELICQGYINEQRYAELFAVSKFHQNKWGKIKIAYYLKQKHISEACIKKGLEAIDYDEYISLIAEIFSSSAVAIIFCWRSSSGRACFLRPGVPDLLSASPRGIRASL